MSWLPTLEMALVIGASFLVVASLGVLVYLALSASKARAQRTSAPGRPPPRPGSSPMSRVRQNELSLSIVDRLAQPFVQDLASAARRLTPSGVMSSTSRRLVVAGLTGSVSVEAILVLKALGVVVFTGTAIWATGWASPGLRLMIVGVVSLVGFVLPDVWIGRKMAARQAEISRALPETLDQLSVVVEAGLGFDSGLLRIVESSSGPLVDEFRRALQNNRLGRTRSESLQEVADRTDVAEVRQFVAAIKQADSLGVPIARIVRSQAEHMRQLKRLEAEEQAMKLPVKMTMPMVLCMLPALFLVLIGPVVIRVMDRL